MAQIVVVGSVNADIVVRVPTHPSRGETVLGDSMAVLAGGKGANQAVAAALLGADVAMVGAVGDDQFADTALRGLRRASVDLSALAVVPGPTGIATVTVAADGENTIVVVPGANASVDADAVRAVAELIATADVVVLQGEIPRSGTEQAARIARGRVVLNLAPVIDLDGQVVRRADPLVVNEHEALRWLQASGLAPSSRTDVVRALLAVGVRSVVMTLGADGALVGLPDGEVQAVAAPRVTPVDTTGAGDALVGALALRLAAGDGLVEASRFAVRVGAFAVTGVGAQPSFPTSDDELPGA